MKYILIILWFPFSSQSGKAIDHIEFSTERACLSAAASVKATQGQGTDMIRTVCAKQYE